MKGKEEISIYRSRFDQTLASRDLSDVKALENLITKKLLPPSENHSEECFKSILEKRTAEVSNLVEMLRSACVTNNGVKGVHAYHAKPYPEWKIKQDTEECRIMYREGLDGSPFHTLIIEGYVDAPVDVCLCVSWESNLYKKWWPCVAFPTFRLLSSSCLQKINIDEQISSVRMKFPWPLSNREALLHFFEVEYFPEDLIIVLMNTLPELESATEEDESKDMVRIEVVGGFAFQKVSSNRSYFRTIANFDIKLNFIPPPLINFISRQLLGSGYKLYKKTVASVSKGDDNFCEALKDSLYNRVQEALYSNHLEREGSEIKEDATEEQ